eukprot:2478679-Prymnesium_polylepis.2
MGAGCWRRPGLRWAVRGCTRGEAPLVRLGNVRERSHMLPSPPSPRGLGGCEAAPPMADFGRRNERWPP